MERHSSNGLKIAKYLEGHPKASKITEGKNNDTVRFKLDNVLDTIIAPMKEVRLKVEQNHGCQLKF